MISSAELLEVFILRPHVRLIPESSPRPMPAFRQPFPGEQLSVVAITVDRPGYLHELRPHLDILKAIDMPSNLLKVGSAMGPRSKRGADAATDQSSFSHAYLDPGTNKPLSTLF
jgi:hypothetical protein